MKQTHRKACRNKEDTKWITARLEGISNKRLKDGKKRLEENDRPKKPIEADTARSWSSQNSDAREAFLHLKPNGDDEKGLGTSSRSGSDGEERDWGAGFLLRSFLTLRVCSQLITFVKFWVLKTKILVCWKNCKQASTAPWKPRDNQEMLVGCLAGPLPPKFPDRVSESQLPKKPSSGMNVCDIQESQWNRIGDRVLCSKCLLFSNIFIMEYIVYILYNA